MSFNSMRKILTWGTLLPLLIFHNVYGKTPDFIFDDSNVVGTTIVSSLRSQQTHRINRARASVPFASASTFKIPNTLIAIQEGLIDNASSTFIWDKVERDYGPWNQDQTLKSAFSLSCVWCYQQIARQVSSTAYTTYIEQFQFGILAESFQQTEFWLNGELKISAEQQITFLKALYQRKFAIDDKAFDVLSEIMFIEAQDGFKLWGKTGWAERVSPQVGWFVGYVETPDDVWFFATNIEIRSPSDLKKRVAVTKKVLHYYGIWPLQ